MDANKRTLWLDYDDTLGGVLINGKIEQGHRAYFDCIDRFVRYVEVLGIDGELARAKQQDIDMEAAKRVGFGDKTRFAQSMVAAYRALCGGTPSQFIANDIFAIGMSVFTDYPYVSLEGVPEVLEILRPTCNLIVVTKGELVEQNKKLAEAGLRDLVDEVIVMEHKSKAEWVERVFAPKGFNTPDDLAKTVAIGNSVKSDVNPPVDLGANGVVLIDHGNWDFEKAGHTTPLPGRKLVTIESMIDLPRILNSL